MENILEIKNLVTSFAADGRRERDIALNGIDLAIPRGKAVGLVGESGCGKSVTALSIMGLLPDNGRVEAGVALFSGVDLLRLPDRELRKLRGDRISMIFQEPMTSLNPLMTVGKQVSEALILHRGLDRGAARQRVIEVLGQVDIPDPERCYGSYPHQLSGGMRQRVMIGMAMALTPELLIADEPTTALDVSIQEQIIRLMARLHNHNRDTSILLISHNLGVVAALCDEIYVMYAGEVVEYGDIFTIFKKRAHPYSKGLMASLPGLTPKGQRLYNIRGTVPNLRAMPAGCRFAPRCEYATQRCHDEKPPLVDIGGGHLCRCFMEGKVENHG